MAVMQKALKKTILFFNKYICLHVFDLAMVGGMELFLGRRQGKIVQ